MRGKIILMLLAVSMLLSGCGSWMNGSYVSVKPHKEESTQQNAGAITASSYSQLYTAIQSLGESGTQSAVISVEDYDPDRLESDLDRAISALKNSSPICAYAVDTVTYELGTSGGASAVALNITYLHDRTEILKIKHLKTMEDTKSHVYDELDDCGSGIVMLVNEYTELDYQQLTADYADLNPELVMEVPQVVVNVYPESGQRRVVEIKFLYQHSRDSLRTMQQVVQPVFSAAGLSVIVDADTDVKFSQLYSFLMERYDYKIEASITPAYSLLRHGVGDRKAFATVYAAMCREADLECRIVTGTRDGKSWYWNIIRVDDVYYHVDLVRFSAEGAFRLMTDDQMTGYVWDYSAYPQCGVVITMEENSEEQ